MKATQKANLNIGVRAFILNREFNGKLAVQERPITWDWETNDIVNVTIKPTLLRGIEGLDSWQKLFPYMLFLEDKEWLGCKDWESALETAEYLLNRTGAKIGLSKVDLKQFVKNEPKITFSEVHEILRKMDVLT